MLSDKKRKALLTTLTVLAIAALFSSPAAAQLGKNICGQMSSGLQSSIKSLIQTLVTISILLGVVSFIGGMLGAQVQKYVFGAFGDGGGDDGKLMGIDFNTMKKAGAIPFIVPLLIYGAGFLFGLVGIDVGCILPP